MKICYIFLLHFIGDFLLQSRKMANRKSERPEYLIAHIAIVFAVMLLGGWVILPFQDSFALAAVAVFIHGLIDFFVWAGYRWWIKRTLPDFARYEFWEDTKFYAALGLDQLLHYITIILVYGGML